jgi:transcription initiation factor TFIID subunit 5
VSLAVLCFLTGHEEAIYSLSFSADGTVLASSGADETVRIWDMQKGGDFSLLSAPASLSPCHTFRTKATPVLDVRFTERNLLVASGPSCQHL